MWNLCLFRQMKQTDKTTLIPVVLRQQFRVTKTLHRHHCTDLSETPLKYYYGDLEWSDRDNKKFVLWGLPFQCRHPEVTTVKQVKEEGRKERTARAHAKNNAGIDGSTQLATDLAPG